MYTKLQWKDCNAKKRLDFRSEHSLLVKVYPSFFFSPLEIASHLPTDAPHRATADAPADASCLESTSAYHMPCRRTSMCVSVTSAWHAWRAVPRIRRPITNPRPRPNVFLLVRTLSFFSPDRFGLSRPFLGMLRYLLSTQRRGAVEFTWRRSTEMFTWETLRKHRHEEYFSFSCLEWSLRMSGGGIGDGTHTHTPSHSSLRSM